MNDFLMPLLKISLAIFMVGNLLDMGLRLAPQQAVSGLRNIRFVVLSLFWGFVVGPALAFAIARTLPIEPHYAAGLILIGMAPCAPFLPAIVGRVGGDLGFTAAYMLLSAVGMVVFMPLAVPVAIEGLSVSAWTIAEPLLLVVLLPLVIGMAILRASASLANRLQPYVKKITGVATAVMLLLCLVVYGKQLLGVGGTLAIATQLIFFLAMTALPYWLGFGLGHEQRFILSLGSATRNIGAALAPLLSVPDVDQRTMIMVVLGVPIMLVFAMLAARFFGRQPG